MATKKELLEKLDKIDDEELAHMLALVAYRESQEELDQLIQSEEYTPPDEIQMRTFQEKFHKDSQRALHRSKSRIMRWACGIAAAAVFAFAVPISADNVTIFELVAQVFTDHSDISSLEGYEFKKPEGWNCEYYPTWIPKSYILSNIYSDSYIQSMTFKNALNQSFSFSYSGIWSNDYNNVSIDQFTPHTILVDNQPVTAYYSNDGCQIILSFGVSSGTLTIDGELTSDQLIKIAENIYGL